MWAGQPAKVVVVDGFPRVLRPVCWDRRWLLARHVWVGGGGCAGKLCSLLAGRQVCIMGCKQYSMSVHPFSSPLPSPPQQSLLQVQTFSQVCSVVDFHSSALSALLPPPVTHHFLIPQAVSTLPTPAYSQGLTSRGLGLVAHPPPRHFCFWCLCQ